MNEVGMIAILTISVINAIIFAFTKHQSSAFSAIWIILVGIFLAVAK